MAQTLSPPYYYSLAVPDAGRRSFPRESRSRWKDIRESSREIQTWERNRSRCI